MTPGFKAKQTQELGGFEIDELFRHVSKATHQLQIFKTGEVSVDMRFLGNVAEGSTVTLKIQADTFAFKEYLAGIGFEQCGNDLDRGGLAGAVGADVTDDLTGADAETDPINGWQAAIA